MARQVLPIAGAAIGFFIGGPAGAQWGYMIGSVVGNAVDPQIIKGPRLGEAGLQTSAEGVFRPIVFGTDAIKGNVISRGNRKVKTKRTQQSKGGGPVTEEQRVYWTFAIRLCEGPISAVTRIWMDEKLVYDIRSTSTLVAESAEFAERFRLYLGDESQLPDPDIEAYVGIGNTPAYRGTAYAVFPNYDLTDRRESIPDFRFEVASVATQAVPNTVMALGTTAVLNFRTVNSPDGLDWTATPQLIATGHVRLLALSDGRFLSYSPSEAQYSDDFGVTWTTSTGSLGGYGGERDAYHHSGRVLMPGGGNGVYISTDNGETFEQVPLSPYSNAIAIADTMSVSMANTTGDALYVWYSTDGGLTWNQGAAGDGFAVAGDFHVETNGIKFIIGAQKAGLPHLWITANGTDISSEIDLTGTSATTVTAIRNHEDVWLVGTDTGDLFYSTDDGASFQLCPDTIPDRIDAIVHNGERFVLGGSSLPAVIAVTNDGSSLTTVSHPFVDDFFDLAANKLLGVPPADGQPFILGDFVSAMHRFAGHATGDYDVSELTDEVTGLVIAGDYNCGDAIRSVMPVYFFDASEYDAGSGYKIHYHKRGKPVVRTITVDDLLSAPEKSVREDALERPRVLHLHYESPQVGYVPAKATERRDTPDILVVGERSIQVPVAFADQDEPAQIVQKLMKVVWTEVGGEEEFTLHDGNLDLVPSDCIGVSLRGQLRRMRITQQWISMGEIKMRLIRDRQSAYTSNVTGIPLPPPTPPLPSIAGTTIPAYLDIPALNDNNDRLLYYYAGTGQEGGWFGFTLQRKEPSDLEFSDVESFTSRAVMGVLLDDVASASEHYTDTTNVVRVQLYSDDVIDGLTEAQFLSEGGAFALQNADDTWEVMQYRDADDEGDGVFALSYLARGRLNSGPMAHAAGRKFVLLDGVKSVDAVTAWIGQTLIHRPVSFGSSPDGAPQYSDDYVGKSQIEFPCAHLFLDRDGDSILADTVPRHRFGTEVMPVRSINWIGYRWTATDGSSTQTADSIADSVSFDVTGWASPVTVTVSQINRITGAGPAISEQIA